MVKDVLGALARMATLTSEAECYGRALCDIGVKYAGTPGETKAREFILSALRDLNYSPMIEPFEYLHYLPLSASVKVMHPLRETLRAEPLQFSASSEVEGDMIYVGDGSKDQFDRLVSCGSDFKDKIVVTTGWPPFLLYHLAEERGAAGYAVITRPPENLIAVGCAVSEPRKGSVPGVLVGSEDGHRLLSLQSTGQVRLRLSSNGEFSRKTSANLLVEIAGDERPEEKVIVCSHYDSQCKGSHAWDNVSGDIALLCLARAAADLRPRRTLQFYFCGVEEQGICSGSRTFVEKHADEMKNYMAVVNFDGLSSLLSPRNVIQATPQALEFARSVAREQGWAVHSCAPLQPNSDHAPFVEAGVPAIWAHEGPRSPYQHTEADVFAHLDMQKLLGTAMVGARCALDLAYDPSISLSRPAPHAPWSP